MEEVGRRGSEHGTRRACVSSFGRARPAPRPEFKAVEHGSDLKEVRDRAWGVAFGGEEKLQGNQHGCPRGVTLLFIRLESSDSSK